MSENVIQTSFSAGELSPSLFARVDFAKYHSGAARMRNFFVDYRSGASTRAGTEYIRPAYQQGVRLVRFQQSVDVTFILEFGHGVLRFISDGASIVTTPQAIGNVIKGSSTTVTIAGTIPNGTLVFISGAQGMLQIDNRYFIVTNSVAGSFSLIDPTTGQAVNSTNWFNYTGGGTVAPVYQIGTPYTLQQLPLLKFSQKGNQMNITHPVHDPYVLTLFSATNWTLVPAAIGSTAGVPSITAVNSVFPTTSTADPPVPPQPVCYYMYKVTSVDVNDQESGPSAPAITGIQPDMRIDSGSNQITWNPVAGAFAYNVYRAAISFSPLGGSEAVGFIGSTTSTVFIDNNIAPDFAQTPPIPYNPITALGIHPGCSAYFQQRLVYANGGGNYVDWFWMSRPAAYYNFDLSNPSQSDDEVDGELVSLEVNEIKSMIPMPAGLVCLTSKGVWQLSGGAGGVATAGGPITPTTITATAQAYIGASDVPPLLVNYDIMFVQSRGSIIRDLTYNIYANIYTGNDVSILSSHLFFGHQVKEWAYAEEPFKIIWVVREDGVMLSLTLLKEQDMYGWARHDTYGNFTSVATVTEGHTDATYVVVDRPLPNGIGFSTSIERLSDRTFPFGAEDAWSVDAGVRNVSNTPNTVLIGTQTDASGNATFVALAPTFSSDMVGWILRVNGGKFEVTQFFNTQTVGVKEIQPAQGIPNDPLDRLDPAPAGTWSVDKPFTQVFGLDHLEGQQVSVLADGGVIYGLTVADSSITLPQPATKVIVGYGFQCQLQTMPLDLGGESNTVQGKRKKIGALTVRCKDSRGVKAGRTFDTLTPIKEMNRVTQMGQPVKLVTGDERIVMDPLWDVPGQICLQVDDPLPATILGVVPEVVVGDGSK